MPMNTVEIAKNIDKVRIRKIKAFAKYINIEDVESKGRMELIEEIKNNHRYKSLVNRNTNNKTRNRSKKKQRRGSCLRNGEFRKT